MKPGDYVIKAKGHRSGSYGIVLDISKHKTGQSDWVLVYSKGIKRKWFSEFVEVINEAR